MAIASGGAGAAAATTLRSVTVAGGIHVADEPIYLRNHLQQMYEGHVKTTTK